MTTLDMSVPDQLRLTLRGDAENRILTTVRHLPYWREVAIERDPDDMQRTLSVTLIADRTHEPTVREILKRSFRLTFPPDGGSQELPLP